MSQTRYLKSMITPTLVEPTENHGTGVASGVWSTQDQLEARRGGVWPEAGVANPDTLIEGNFATTLYEGNGSTQSITTGIDSVNKDSLVWIKNRDAADSHVLTDTVRGATKILHADTRVAEATDADTITAFSSTGFALGDDLKVNTNGESYCAWTFKKAPKFFDIVTYTGTGSARTVAHNLGSVPGMMIVKLTSGTDGWHVYHRKANNGSSPEDYYLAFITDAEIDNDSIWNDTAPTDSVFTVGTNGGVNGDGESYVAYLFAHETGDDSMIQCDSYTGNNNTDGPVIDLGFEPQWLLVKKASGNGNSWSILDNMRGIHTSAPPRLMPNVNNEEFSNADNDIALQANGFKVSGTGGSYNDNNKIYIYVAIRRPNMATITDATEVFATDTRTNSEGEGKYDSGFPVDFSIARTFDATSNNFALTRLTHAHFQTNDNVAEGTSVGDVLWDVMDGFTIGGSGLNAFFGSSTDNINWMWKRAKGYFDVVAYTGTGSTQTVAHGLTVAPEMMWIKNRGVADNWAVYYGDNTDYLILNTTAATADSANWWNDTSPTSSVFTVKSDHSVNASGELYIAYLFATLAGVSKVGSVTHSGSSTDVDCGFSAGSRFVLLKRTDATGSWFVWDSTRGIIAGNDPYVLLDTNAAQVTNTDLIDPLASGFQISGDFTDGDYIFYAIA